MQIPRRNPELGTMTFAEFAKDHKEHSHCVGCWNCIVDPSPRVRLSSPIWCVGCRDAIKVKLPDGVRPPWDWENK